jgi:hypothetical protein
MSDDFNDEHSGRGGSYMAGADGKRVLNERTDGTTGQSTKPPADGGQVAGHDHAAPAGQQLNPAPAKTINQSKVRGARNA